MKHLIFILPFFILGTACCASDPKALPSASPSVEVSPSPSPVVEKKKSKKQKKSKKAE